MEVRLYTQTEWKKIKKTFIFDLSSTNYKSYFDIRASMKKIKYKNIAVYQEVSPLHDSMFNRQ